MEFLCNIRLPDATTVLTMQGSDQPPLTEPTKVIRECIEREGGKVTLLKGCNGGWDCFCVFETQSPEAQVRACLAMHTAGFVTDTRTSIDGEQLDKAWRNAVEHPVAAGRATATR